MKKLFFLPLAALLLVACHHSQSPKPQPDSTPTVQQPAADETQTPDVAQDTILSSTAQEFVRDTTAPLGSPQNPIKVEPGKPIDFSQIFKQNHETRSFAERSAQQIDSIRIKAEKGDINAMFHYGVCFEQGWGVDKDLSKALEWYQKAADQGNNHSLFNLGVFYERGKGVKHSSPKNYITFAFFYV